VTRPTRSGTTTDPTCFRAGTILVVFVKMPDCPSSPVLLHELAWPAIAALVAGGESLCLLPVGATEQHGRHLPTNTDTVIAEELCWAASAQTGVPVLPAIAVSSSQAHTARWPGTIALTPRTFIEVCVEIAHWVERSGFERLLYVNAHGGNVAPIRVALDELRCEGNLQVGLVNWHELSSELNARVLSDGADVHANRAETAVMLHLRPELVDRSEIVDDPDRTPGKVFSYTVAQTSQTGVTGFPTQASPEEGRTLFSAAVDALVPLIGVARQEHPPLENG
jgi:creatinine amidohydrolase